MFSMYVHTYTNESTIYIFVQPAFIPATYHESRVCVYIYLVLLKYYTEFCCRFVPWVPD